MRLPFLMMRVMATMALVLSSQTSFAQMVNGQRNDAARRSTSDVARGGSPLTGMHGSAGTGQTYTGIGAPTGASATNTNGRGNAVHGRTQ